MAPQFVGPIIFYTASPFLTMTTQLHPGELLWWPHDSSYRFLELNHLSPHESNYYCLKRAATAMNQHDVNHRLYLNWTTTTKIASHFGGGGGVANLLNCGGCMVVIVLPRVGAKVRE